MAGRVLQAGLPATTADEIAEVEKKVQKLSPGGVILLTSPNGILDLMAIDAIQLAELIRGHAEALRFWTNSRCSCPEDVVQEAFCRLAVQEPPPENPVSWLYRVSRNLAEKQRRSDTRRRKREAACPPADAYHSGNSLEVAETVAAVDQLDAELREVLVARIWGGLSLAEIAGLCGVSTATACRRYHAALEALRNKLGIRSEKPR